MRTPVRTLGAATAALVLALLGAVSATAKSTEIALEVEGAGKVLVGTAHELLVTATKTADDPSNPIACIALTAPSGWTGLTVLEGLQPMSGWSSDDGPPATWSADTGSGKLSALGATAQVRVSVMAPAMPETGTWTVRLHDSINCVDTPMLTTTFEVDAVTEIIEPVAQLILSPASASVTTGAAHAVTATAQWITVDGEEIGCLIATLPDGWTAPGFDPGAPMTWVGEVEGSSVAWAAGSEAVTISSPGASASYVIRATAPATPGSYAWDVDVFAATDCSGEPFLSGTALVTVAAPPSGGGGTAVTTEVVPEVLAAEPPVPQAIPAGEGPLPFARRTGTAAALAGAAAAAAGLAALVRRRSAAREPAREPVEAPRRRAEHRRGARR